jgi:glycosyltransferase involved in cell wall biosynthesis
MAASKKVKFQMRVVFITREGYNLPGARIRCYNFAREIAKYGINTEVLSFSDTLGAKDGEKESHMGIGEKIGFNWTAFKRLIKDKETIFYIQRFNYHSLAPYLAHLLNKNRIILDLDDWEMRENPKYYLGFYPSSKAHYLTREIAKRSIFCVAASRFLQRFLLQFNKKVCYLPTGVDAEVFKPSSKVLNKDRILFSWIGTFHKKEYIENINFALDCFTALRKKYSHIYFDIVGEGIYKNDLMKILTEYNDPNIQFRGWIPPDEVPEYLTTIDSGLFPALRDNKFNRAKSPTKLFEYMAMAKPTVSTAIGEATHIIEDNKNGFLAKTEHDFINKMQRLIENKDLRQRMGQAARKYVEKEYSLKAIGEQLLEILRNNQCLKFL